MNAKQVLFTSIVSLAAASAMADDITIDSAPVTSTVTRAEVKADVLKARRAGELLAAGEGYQGVPTPVASIVARADVKSQVISARTSGELLAAGEGRPTDSRGYAVSTLSRTEVKAQVIAARQAGQLLPAGEAYPAPRTAAQHSVHAGNPFSKLAKVLHRSTDVTNQ